MRKLQICFTVLVLGWLTGGGRAHALPEYPKYLQTAADTPCLPHCNVCHRDDNAGDGTIDRPFGKSIERVGRLRGGGQSSITQAVDTLRAQNTDSDGDGIADIDELSHGEDPNYAGDGSICGPQVGCSAAAGAQSVWSSGLTVLVVFSLMAWAGRARKRSRLTARQG
jgi:hypothetical protein